MFAWNEWTVFVIRERLSVWVLVNQCDTTGSVIMQACGAFCGCWIGIVLEVGWMDVARKSLLCGAGSNGGCAVGGGMGVV